MRASITVGIPIDATAGQLQALAGLLGAVERARWSSLVSTFAKLEREGVQLPESLETMLGQLAGQLRVEAHHREPKPAGAARGA